MPRKFYCAKDDEEQSLIALLGIPFDATSSFRPGSRFAPDTIRLYSEIIESYSPYQDRDLEDVSFYDAGNIEITVSNFSVLRSAVSLQVAELLKNGKKVVTMGGEHLISLPIIEAYFKAYPHLKVLHFDAHADLRDDYLGEKYSHAAVIRRICEVVGASNVYQFGVRSGTKEEFAYAPNATNFYPFDLNVQDLEAVVEDIQDAPVYITLDLDVLDPAYFPGTGTPEPGGWTFHDLLQALLLVKDVNLVGADLVELCPAYDRSDIATITAIKLLREIILLLSK